MKHLSTPVRAFRLLIGLAVCAVMPNLGHAQSLTIDDVLSPLGTIYHTIVITGEAPWDTLHGAGVTWNYGWIQVDTTDGTTRSAILPADAPGIGNYPTANHVMRAVSDNNTSYVSYDFYHQQADRLQQLGSITPVLNSTYSAPGIAFAYPMALGDTVRDGYCYTSTGLGSTFHFCGQNYVTFDAAGTLVLPTGTYTGVKHMTKWESSHESMQTAGDSTYSVRQQWFAPGIAYPLLDVLLFIGSGGPGAPAGQLMNGNSIAGIAPNDAIAQVSAYPNPAHGSITLTGVASSLRSIELIDALGQIMQRAVGSGGTVDINGLASGCYTAVLRSAGGVRVMKVMVE